MVISRIISKRLKNSYFSEHFTAKQSDIFNVLLCQMCAYTGELLHLLRAYLDSPLVAVRSTAICGVQTELHLGVQ